MATARKGGMAVGTTVARINVKVSPDTKAFRSELKAELDAIDLPIDDLAALPIKFTFLDYNSELLFSWINEDLFA